MMVPRFIVGFCGHRDVTDPGRLDAAIARELRTLKSLAEAAGGVLEYYGSIAYGADTIAAEAAHRLGLPVHLILPKPILTDPTTGRVDHERGFAADFVDRTAEPPRFRQADWDRALARIDAARRGENGGTLRVVAGSHLDPECYYDTGLAILDATDVLLAVWDHRPERGLGGTAQFVNAARQTKLPTVVIHATTLDVESSGLGAISSDDAGATLIREVDRYGCVDGAKSPPVGEESADAIQARLDDCSTKESVRFRSSLIRIIYAHGFATLIAAFASLLPQTSTPWKIALTIFAFTEACFVAWAVWRARAMHHGMVHERWLQTRFATELMRGIFDGGSWVDPLHPLIARHQPRWRRFATSFGLLAARARPRDRSWTDARDAYVAERLRDPSPMRGQIAYFATRQQVAEPHFRRTLRGGTWLGRLALLFVLGALVYKLISIGAQLKTDALAVSAASWKSWLLDLCFKFLPIALPLMTGVAIALRTALDSGRRTFRYRELAERLTAAAVHIASLQTESSVRRAVAATEEVLLDELIEWQLAEHQNGAH